MFAEQRQQRIVEQARQAGRVDVAELAAELAVTPETVRRDLSALERQGVLRRVHGGAMPVERLGFEPGLAARDAVRQAEKERIAKAALAELPVEGSILLDAGTTTARLAEILPANRDLTVVTNSLPIAIGLSVRPGVTVLMTGGRVRGRTQAAVGDAAVRVLGDTFVDVAFLGTNGITPERGLTTPDPDEAAVKRAMLAAARRVVVLADHTKVERPTSPGLETWARWLSSSPTPDWTLTSPPGWRRPDPRWCAHDRDPHAEPECRPDHRGRRPAPGAVLRARDTRVDPGGKGVNVSRALAANGRETVAVLPAGAGRASSWPACSPRSTSRWWSSPSPGRANVSVVEPDGTVTKLNEPGPRLSAEEVEAVTAATVKAAADAEWLACTGSLPPGAPIDFYARVVERLGGAPVKVAIDSSGAPCWPPSTPAPT